MRNCLARLVGPGVAAAFLGAAVMLFSGQNSLAQSPVDNYPNKPIKVIVPFAPGGSVDIVACVIGQKLTEAWGQTVLIETRPVAIPNIGDRLPAIELTSSTPEEAKNFVRSEIARWTPVIK